MAYVAPAWNAIPFVFKGEAYTPPAGSALVFEFAPSLLLVGVGVLHGLDGLATIQQGTAMSCAGTLALFGEAALDAADAAELSVAAALVMGGSLAFYFGEPFVLQGAGALWMVGTSTFFVVPMLVGTGSLSKASGTALLSVGTTLSVSGHAYFSGGAQFYHGPFLVAGGHLPRFSGSAQLQHGCAFSADAAWFSMSGGALFDHAAPYSLVCSGVLRFGGLVNIALPPRPNFYTIWRLVTPDIITVFLP